MVRDRLKEPPGHVDPAAPSLVFKMRHTGLVAAALTRAKVSSASSPVTWRPKSLIPSGSRLAASPTKVANSSKVTRPDGLSARGVR